MGILFTLSNLLLDLIQNNRVLSALIALFIFYRLGRFLIRLVGPYKEVVIGFPVGHDDQSTASVQDAFKGFMTDFISVLSQRLRYKPIIKIIEAEDSANELVSGSVDIVVIDSTSIMHSTPDLEVIPCHTAYLNSLALIFWDKVPQHVVSLYDFIFYPNNMTAVIGGSLEDNYINRYDMIRVRRVDSFGQLIVDLKLGIVRAGLVRHEHAYCLQKEYGNLKILPIALHKKCLVQDEKLAIARNNSELIQEVEEMVFKMKKDETSLKLHQKWFGFVDDATLSEIAKRPVRDSHDSNEPGRLS